MSTYSASLASGAFLSAANISAYQLGTSDFTVEAWVCTAAAGGSGTIISSKSTEGGVSSDGGFLLVLRSDGTIKIATDNGFGFYEVDSVVTSVNDGTWHFVAAVRQGASLSIYVDGVLVGASPRGTATPPLNIINFNPLTIGTTSQAQEPYRNLTGQLGMVSFWKVARTAQQIASDMRTILTGNEPGLTGYWTFSNQNGADSSLNHNTANPVGTVTYPSPGPPDEYYAAVLAKQAYFQAASNNAYQFGTSDFTIEAWVKFAQAGGDGTIMSRKSGQGGPNEGGFLLVIKPTGSIKLATDNGTTYFEIDTAVTNVNDGNWHFVAAVRQGAQISVYVDTVLITGQYNGGGPPPLNVNNPEPLTLGTSLQQQEPYRFFSGQLDNIALWQGARSAATIAADFSTRFTGSEPGLVGFWSFDFRDGRDQSPTHNKAVAVGTISYLPPGAPIGQAITGVPAFTQASYDGLNVKATWSAVQQPQVTGYHLVLYDGQNELGYKDSTTTNGSIPATLTTGTYTLRVRAIGNGVVGPISKALPVVGGAPTAVTVVTDTLIHTQWRASNGAATYRATLWDGITEIEHKDSSTTTADLPMPPTTTKPYTVSVQGFAGTGGISSGPVSSPQVGVILTAPTILTADYDGKTLKVSWSAPPGQTVAAYYVSVLSGNSEIAHATPATTSASIPVPVGGNPTSVKVKGTATSSTGPWSSLANIAVAIPESLLAGTNGTAVAAQWVAAAGATGYEAALSINGVWQTPQSSATTNIVFTQPMVANTKYLVKVRVKNGVSTGPYCTPVPGPFQISKVITYDSFGRLTGVSSPGLAASVYAYDSLGNITTVTITSQVSTLKNKSKKNAN
jgi:YD repeat-containing protein